MEIPTHRFATRDDARLRIELLGSFRVIRESQPVTFGRKLPKKPLSILKWLAASSGLSADVNGMADKLWPDLDGDAARRAFDIALYRLRRMLGVEDLLVLSGGRLGIDSDKCWIDVREFEAMVKRMEAAMCLGARCGIGECQAYAAELLQIYAGHFLEYESPEPWVLPYRDQLSEKFRRAVVLLAACLEHHGRWDLAAALYSRALELDNLAEPLYRRLMLCYRELGETAEALRVFRRCRDLLSVVLSASPSAETRAVHATLACRPPVRSE